MDKEKLGYIKVRLNEGHYGGGLVDSVSLIGLISDAGCELMVAKSGDVALMAAWQHVEQYVPVFAGDTLEVKTWFSRYGNTSADLEGEVYKVGTMEGESAATIIDPPVLVMKATFTGVVKKELNRGLQVEKLEDIPFIAAGETKWWEKR